MNSYLFLEHTVFHLTISNDTGFAFVIFFFFSSLCKKVTFYKYDLRIYKKSRMLQ